MGSGNHTNAVGESGGRGRQITRHGWPKVFADKQKQQQYRLATARAHRSNKLPRRNGYILDHVPEVGTDVQNIIRAIPLQRAARSATTNPPLAPRWPRPRSSNRRSSNRRSSNRRSSNRGSSNNNNNNNNDNQDVEIPELVWKNGGWKRKDEAQGQGAPGNSRATTGQRGY